MTDAMTNATTHALSPPEIVCSAVPEDERVWVPQAPSVWFRPLMLNTLQGQWCNLLRVRKSGILSRHRHPAPVHGSVIKGQWRYLEHDWVARAGAYVFEPPKILVSVMHSCVNPAALSDGESNGLCAPSTFVTLENSRKANAMRRLSFPSDRTLITTHERMTDTEGPSVGPP